MSAPERLERIRRQLAEELGQSVPDETWEYLIEKRYIEDVLAADLPIPGLADEVRAILRAGGHPVGRRRRAPRMLPAEGEEADARDERLRQVVLARLLARQAQRDEEVRSFRADVLGGQLISPEQVEEWMVQHYDLEGATVWLVTPMPPGHEIVLGPEPIAIDPPVTITALHEESYGQYIPYGVPGDDREHWVPIAAGGVLERLHGLGERLASDYGWSLAQAVVFILTGTAPVVALITSGVHVSYPITAPTRIELRIDPAVSPQELASYYRRLRRSVLGQRYRKMSRKHLQLALFAAARPYDEPWGVGMDRWNRLTPDPNWKYRAETNFGRDCKKALERLLRPRYQVPSARGDEEGV